MSDLGRTLVIVCDVWDVHWCRGATERLGPLARRISSFLDDARHEGAEVVHAPSDAMAFYEGHPARTRALAVPLVEAPTVELKPYPAPPMPAECGCDPPCTPLEHPPWPWTRQHAAIDIAPSDWIADEGDIVRAIYEHVDAERVLICGVHLNICVLERPFGVVAMRRWGLPVAVLRDLTEAWNPSITDEVILYIERHHCPAIKGG